MENEKIEREYDIKIIASILENAFLCNNEGEIYDASQDLINEEVDILNYKEKSIKVIKELKEQYPTLKRITPYPTGNFGYDLINYVQEYYIKNYGETITLKVYPIKRKKLVPFHFKCK